MKVPAQHSAAELARARDLLAPATAAGGLHQRARLSDRDYAWLRRRGFVRGLYSMPADGHGERTRYFSLAPAGEAIFKCAPSPARVTPARILPRLKDSNAQ